MMDHSGVSYSDEGFQRYEMEVFQAFMHWGGFVVLHSPLWAPGDEKFHRDSVVLSIVVEFFVPRTPYGWMDCVLRMSRA